MANDQITAANELIVLSLGYTRSLWKAEKFDGDTERRLTAYASRIESYHVVAHAKKRHKLAPTVQLRANFFAYATNGLTLLDSWYHIIQLGRKINAEHDVTLIQAQDPAFTGTAAVLLSRLLGKPFNVCVYGSNPYDDFWLQSSWRNRLMSVVARYVIKRADRVQVDGKQTAGSLIEAGIAPRKVVIKPLPPGDLSEFQKLTRDEKLRRTLTDNGHYQQLGLFIGRIAPQKNLSMLFDAAESLTDRSVRFICIGDGPLLTALKRETAERGLSERILWVGAQNREDVLRYFSSCDFFVLPSLYEGFARVLMEAVAANLPVVATKVSGVGELIISGKNGYVVPVDDSSAFTAAIACVLDGCLDNHKALNQTLIEEVLDYDRSVDTQVKIWEGMAHEAATRL